VVFLSNSAEQPLLVAGTRQGEIAAELYKGVVAWFATH
jgi:N-acetylmuramoyl-L-alanine amidase